MASCPPGAFTIGIVYTKPLELFAITPMLDERYMSIPVARGDNNHYTLGRIGAHNVVIVGPARGDQGTIATAQFITAVNLTFPNVTFGLLVGIGGGIPHYPEHDVRLGDVIVGAPETGPAVVQYNLGKRTAEGTSSVRTLAKPPSSLLSVINSLEDKYMSRQDGGDDILKPHLDRLTQFPRLKHYQRPSAPDRFFQAEYLHPLDSDCASHALCIEMEAAGLMDVFPCLVVRGVCDYADSHKTDVWQRYAAATAAAYAREVLLIMSPQISTLSATDTAAAATTTTAGRAGSKTQDTGLMETTRRSTSVAGADDGFPYSTFNNYGSSVTYNRGSVTNHFGPRR